MSYITDTLSLMSRPSASITLAMPRFGCRRSTTYEPFAYAFPPSLKSLVACRT